MTQFGQYLKECRSVLELTQYEIADKLGLERSTYTFYETGKTMPSIVVLLKLAKIYNVPCSEFLKVINRQFDLNAPVLYDDLYKYWYNIVIYFFEKICECWTHNF